LNHVVIVVVGSSDGLNHVVSVVVVVVEVLYELPFAKRRCRCLHQGVAEGL